MSNIHALAIHRHICELTYIYYLLVVMINPTNLKNRFEGEQGPLEGEDVVRDVAKANAHQAFDQNKKKTVPLPNDASPANMEPVMVDNPQPSGGQTLSDAEPANKSCSIDLTEPLKQQYHKDRFANIEKKNTKYAKFFSSW